MKIKKISIWLGIIILIALLASSCAPCPEEDCPEPPICPECQTCPVCEVCPDCESGCIDRCVDFTGFLVGTNFLNEFELDNFGFESIDGSDLEVREYDGVRSLNLYTAGIRIFMPCPAAEVTLTLGSWAGGPIKVTAYNGSKDFVTEVSVPGDNSFHTVTLSGSDIQMVAITEVGQNEGALAEICVVFE